MANMKNLLRREWATMVAGLVTIPEGKGMLSLPLTNGAYQRPHGQPVPLAQLENAAKTKGYLVLLTSNTINVARPHQWGVSKG